MPLWSCDYVGLARLKPLVTEKNIYGFLKKGSGLQLKSQSEYFLKDHDYLEGQFIYRSRFMGSLDDLLQGRRGNPLRRFSRSIDCSRSFKDLR